MAGLSKRRGLGCFPKFPTKEVTPRKKEPGWIPKNQWQKEKGEDPFEIYGHFGGSINKFMYL